MEIIRCWEEEGVTIQEPFRRHIKVLLAPDVRNVQELTFSQAIIYPRSRTDYHEHNRPELIMILSGRGVSICDGAEINIEPDMVLWVRQGEKHQIINTSDESMKLATVFIPAFTARENFERCQRAAADARKQPEPVE